MRRLAVLLATAALMVPAIVVMAGETADYKDTFDGGNYSGNSGSLAFGGPWTEYGDGGGHSSGLVHVDSSGCSGSCVHIDGPGVVLTAYGLERSADLSMFQSVTLSFDVEVDPAPVLLGLLENTASLQVQVRDGGWTTVKTFPLKSSTSQHVVVDVSGHINEDFAVRFGLPIVQLTYNGTASIDNVRLSGTVITTTTTSTTTSTTTTTTTASGPTTSTTTTTRPAGSGQPTTSTSQPSTSSTIPGSSPTTTVAGASDGGDGDGGATGATTTTSAGATTSTTEEDEVAVAPGIPPGSGLHEAGVGLISDYESGMMGEFSMAEVEVLGAELTADFSLAVEAFEEARVWIGALALLMAAAVVSGMDRRRSRKAETAT